MSLDKELILIEILIAVFIVILLAMEVGLFKKKLEREAYIVCVVGEVLVIVLGIMIHTLPSLALSCFFVYELYKDYSYLVDNYK